MSDHKPIQIFKAGRHTAMSGAALEFSESDLAACAAAYDPAKHEAPIVVGHPKSDGPAYGWVKSLAFADGLEAEPHQVNPEFAELVNGGAFKKVSASFYTPDSPQNPVPGVYYLRHVGFLGAQPPAVKGLRNPEFAEGEEGVVEFADWGDMQNASLWRRLREWFIADRGLDVADKIIPDYAVATLEDEARKETSDEAPAAPAFTEQSIHQETHVTPEEKAKLEAENAQLKQQLADAAARDKAAQAADRHAKNAAFAEGLVKAGRLLPAEQAVCVAALDFVAGQESVVEFGEGAEKKPLADTFKTFLEGLPKRVEFRELGGGAGGGDLDIEDPLAIHKKAAEFQEAEAKAGRTVDIATAVAHVTAKAAS